MLSDAAGPPVACPASLLYGWGHTAAAARTIQKTDRARAFPVLSKYLELDDPDALEETFSLFAARLPPDLRPNPRGLETVLEFADHPDARAARPEQFMDLSLLDELEREGFFATLPR